MLRFLKTTVLGGILFLVPILIFIAVIGKALELTNKIATPLAQSLPVDSIGDLALVQILAVAILIAFCFLAGLAARTTVAKFRNQCDCNVKAGEHPKKIFGRFKHTIINSPIDAHAITHINANIMPTKSIFLSLFGVGF